MSGSRGEPICLSSSDGGSAGACSAAAPPRTSGSRGHHSSSAASEGAGERRKRPRTAGTFEIVNHLTTLRTRTENSSPFKSYSEAYRAMFSKRALGGVKYSYIGQGRTNYCALYAVINAAEVARQRPFSSAELKARRQWAQRCGLSGGSFIHLTIPQYEAEGFAATDGVRFELLIDPAKSRRKTRRRRVTTDLGSGASVASLTAALRQRPCVLMLQNVNWLTDDWLIKPMAPLSAPSAGRRGRGMNADRGGHAVCAIGLCHVRPKGWPPGKGTLHVVLRDSNAHRPSTQSSAAPVRGVAFVSCADLCAEPDVQLEIALAAGRGVEDGELALTDALGLFVSGLATVMPR